MRAGPASRDDGVPDAVVVGAGHNGLVAANLLADAGWDVVVCEATDSVGGAARSAEVTAPGFVSDLFSAFYPLAAASPAIRSLELEGLGLRWRHAPAVLAHVLPDDRSVLLSRDLEVTAASVDSFAPGDAAAWQRLVAQWRLVEPDLLATALSSFPPVRPGIRLAKTLGVADGLRLARQALLPARRLGAEWFAGEGAALLLAGNALHADIGIDAAGSGLYGWLLSMLGQTYGFPVPEGGSGALTGAMARRLTKAGGSIRVAAPVAGIEISDGVAVGVRLVSGEVVGARRAVLADVAAPILYGRLVEAGALPARLLDDLTLFAWDPPTLKVDWALSAPIPWTAPDVGGAGTVHLGADLNGLTDYTADLSCGRLPTRPFLILGQMTTTDPTRSPAGTESVWAYTHLPAGRPFDAAEVDAHVARIEATLERHAPGFGALVLARDVQSPATLGQRNPNLVDGAINGGTAHLHQQLVFRPIPGLGGAATVIDRLYLAGSSAHPGGGVHGMAGANAARAALRRVRPTGALHRRAMAAGLGRIYGR